MKKICIITNYHKTANYGALLQAFALNKYITKKGYICHTLDFINNEFHTTILKKYYKKIKTRNIKEILKELNKDCRKIIIKRKIETRRESMNSFRSLIPHTDCYTTEKIKDIENFYDVLIAGSDQIWRPNFENELNKVYWLGCFSGNITKASYAASLGINKLPPELEGFAKKYLEEFDFISVREEQANFYLNQIVHDKKILTSIDPVFLLDSKEWSEIIESVNQKNVQSEDYIIVYMIHGNKLLLNSIKMFAQINNLKIITFPYMSYYFKGFEAFFGDIQDFSSTPTDFLNLIMHAKCIFTDSFHASAFSILFHKNFYVSRANEKAISRIENLMQILEVPGRIIPENGLNADQYKLMNNIDWGKIDSNISYERDKSVNYLKGILEK